jgi:hypothetical protein
MTVSSYDVSFYAMTCGDFIKVGITKDIEKRNYELRLMVPLEINVVRNTVYKNVVVEKGPTINIAILIEREAHEQLTNLGLLHRGEWFNNIEKTLSIYDEISTKYNPDYIFSRSEKFIQACDEINNRNITDRRKVQKYLGNDGTFIVERFRKYEPRKLSILTNDYSEQIQKKLGERL